MNNLEKTARIAFSLALMGVTAVLLIGYTVLVSVTSTES